MMVLVKQVMRAHQVVIHLVLLRARVAAATTTNLCLVRLRNSCLLIAAFAVATFNQATGRPLRRLRSRSLTGRGLPPR